jgi:hypothetical protein
MDATGEDGSATHGPVPPSDLARSVFPIGRQTREPWREQALTRAAELGSLAAWARGETSESPDAADTLLRGIEGHLETAKTAAQDRSPLWSVRTRGAGLERVIANLDAAEIDVLKLAPRSWFRSQMPGLLARVRQHLAREDPRRIRTEQIAARALKSELDTFERDTALAAAQAANLRRRQKALRLRNLRAVLLLPIVLLTSSALILALYGAWSPESIPLCFLPDNATVVCPTAQNPLPAPAAPPDQGSTEASSIDINDVTMETVSPSDIAFIEMIGLIAASVSAAMSLRGLRSNAPAYDVPVLLAVLKLPTGALSAVLGLLLIRAGFIPGLTALDSSAQIIAWAVILGYSQQAFTRLIDRSAQAVLEDTLETPRDPRDERSRSEVSGDWG